MSIAERRRRLFTPEEYLILERATETKSEWVDGEIFAMGGGSPEHSTIKINIFGELHRQLKGRSNCRLFESDMKVRSPLPGRHTRGLFTYPDATVVCGEPRFHDREMDVLVNPRVIFEVLSPSTEEYDRGEKRSRYQAIPSLTDYVLVSQDRPLVEHWERDPDGKWSMSQLDQMRMTLSLDSIDCTLALSDIYDRITW